MSWASGSPTTRPMASSRWRRIRGFRAALIRSIASSTVSPWGGQMVRGSSSHWRKTAGVPPLDLLDLEPLPEPLVEVAQLVDPLGAQAQGPADGLGGADDALAGAAVQGGQLDARPGVSARAATSARPRSLRGMSRMPWTRFCSS